MEALDIYSEALQNKAEVKAWLLYVSNRVLTIFSFHLAFGRDETIFRQLFAARRIQNAYWSENTSSQKLGSWNPYDSRKPPTNNPPSFGWLVSSIQFFDCQIRVET